LIQYLAERSKIRWNSSDRGGFYVNEEPAYKSNEGSGASSIDQPSYFFTHGRGGLCGVKALANHAILKTMGYDTVEVTVIQANNGDTPHQIVETFLNGTVYVVDGFNVTPRDIYHEHMCQSILTTNYYPDWYKK
jgi:hypothetical protein